MGLVLQLGKFNKCKEIITLRFILLVIVVIVVIDVIVIIDSYNALNSGIQFLN